MIAELLTPLMLATSPMQITNVEPFKYDHTTQQAVAGEEIKTARMITFNGTQTFDYSGRPADADND